MISLSHITLRRGTKVVLDDVSLTLNPGEKVGLVGRNGAGKSSLFALLAGDLHEDSGDFQIPSGWQMAQVAQHMPETDESATQFVLDGDTRLTRLNAALRAAEAQGDGMAIAQAHSDLLDAGAADASARAQALILGLGFQVAELDHPVNSFSGGWRMRLQLARALMAPSDLLLLDEPTNHLDLDALVWLEGWLGRYPGTLIVISHDREFLDAVTRVTVHIEQGRLTRYGGNYSKFEELRAQQLLLQQAAFDRQQEKMAHLQKFIDRFKAKATKAKQAQSRVKQLERMEKIAPVLAEADFTFTFREPANLPNPMLAITDAAVGYPPASADGAPTTILRGINRSVLAGQRIGILGANGQGKSTLVKTIAHELAPLAGQFTEGKGLTVGYFAQQELDVLRPDDHALAHMTRLARDLAAQGAPAANESREQDLRNYLGSFNFTGDQVMQSVGSFSGGEKARLVLAMIVWQRPNLLLLDEPTNHLDLATREALAMALNDFDGTVLLVSHDRMLLRAVCEDFWLVAQGGVKPYDGDMDDYQRYLLEEAKRQREAAKLAGSASPAAAPAVSAQAPAIDDGLSGGERRKLAAQRRQELAAQLRPHKKALAAAEARMAALQSEQATLEQSLLDNPSPDAMAEAGRRLKAIGDELVAAEEAWLDASTQIEALEAEV
ncbi:ABC transporter [Comamonas serinivorans]|uniref:Probable ATP-binding protein YheS n=1 Tax=Comamonas serinivorans TaxID=1082851 RepID=A0A1Y0EMZ3_9BURK|nr:ATP-binding cassette domain-containing protein [Comamonas serinivorans]ARU04967.1 ABC transporter [Comamonas serinivorans]